MMDKVELYQKIEQVIRQCEGEPTLVASEFAAMIDHPDPATTVIMFAMVAVRVIEWEKQAGMHEEKARNLKRNAELLRNLMTM
jgi:hypothetical protein